MKELTIEEKAKSYDELLDKAKQIYNKENDVLIMHTIEDLFPQLKESKDERIREALIENFKWFCGDYPETTKWGKDDDLLVKDILAWLEKQGEQKPTDKVEPKFHEGEWIISKYMHLVLQIINNDNGSYKTVETDGTERNDSYDFIERNFKLWTIQDAKDGDVLSDGTTIFIFKDLLSDGSVMSYCDYDTDSGESDAFCPLSVNLMCSKITPATKEQRDLLFQKMKEASYEWNAEKKKLNKIEQKSAWSEEDERIYQSIMDDTVQENQLNDEQTNWLRDIKYRYFQQPKQEWSEKDDLILESIIDHIIPDKPFISNGFTDEEFVDWLKTIKHQNTWKPSDEQMKALHELNLTGNISYAGQGQVLIELYNDLKKLKGD